MGRGQLWEVTRKKHGKKGNICFADLNQCLLPHHRGMRDLSPPTRDRTSSPCSGSMESLPLDLQGSHSNQCLLSPMIRFHVI